MDTTDQQKALEELVKKIESGELTEAQELEILKELNFSYDVINKFLEALKVEQLRSEITA